MDRNRRFIDAELANIETALANLAAVKARQERTVVELAAMATFIHNIYTGMESILKHALKAKGMIIARTEAWHKEMLMSAASSGLIEESLADQLYEYLTFRHRFIHSYGFMLEAAALEELSESLPDVYHSLKNAILKAFPDSAEH